MIKNRPLVSIIISNYNYQLWVGEAIQSCLSQNYKNIEVIVVDDCSTDNSRKVIQELQRKNPSVIKSFTTSCQRGPSHARNLGIEKSRGAYFLFLDADDLLLPNAVEFLLESIKKNKTDAAVGGWFNFGNDSGKEKFVDSTFFFPDDPLAGLIKQPMVESAILIKRNSRKWNENICVNEVFDYFFRLFAEGYSISRIKQAVTKKRQHSKPHRITIRYEHYHPPVRLEVITDYKKLLKKKREMTPGREAALDWHILSLIYAARRRGLVDCSSYLKDLNIKKFPNYFWYKPLGLSGFVYRMPPKIGLSFFYFINKILKRV